MDKQENLNSEPDLLKDCARCWRQLPHKLFFFALLLAWLLLFQFYGNATFGYINTASLPGWMYSAYTNPMANGEDGHGALIPILVPILFIWKRHELLSAKIRLWWPGLLILAGSLMLHIIGYMVQQPRVSIVALFGGIYGLMGLAWGPDWLRKCVFPYFLFVFCIPISSLGEPITFPLRMLAVKIVTFFSNYILGVEVLREGTQLFNSAHTFNYEVVAACSGLQSLIAIFLLATVYAFVFLDQGWKRVLMILAALPLAIISNTVRMTCIIIAAEIYGQTGGNYVHDSVIFSLIPYVPAIIGVILLGNWLQGPSANAPLQPKAA